jgi:ATP-binding cassette subfamily B protein
MTMAMPGAITRVRPAASLRTRRVKKFLSYYRPYRLWLAADLAASCLIASTTLALPICANLIIRHLAMGTAASSAIVTLGGVMIGLVALQALCTAFVDYQGHMVGARMEGDMRAELFAHYQRLSFAFYDRQRVGQLMARLTVDPLSLGELYHHGPEDIVIAAIKFAGALAILFWLDAALAAAILAVLPPIAVYAFHYNRRMNRALRGARDRVGDINAQVEDTLSGIRVVQAFANEALETGKFAAANMRFLESRRDGYRAEALFYTGMTAFTQLITVGVIVFGALAILNRAMSLADLLTFVLCVAILIDPIQRMVNLARLYQDGITGFSRFAEMLEIAPDIQDAPHARDWSPGGGAITFDNVSFRYRDDTPHVVEHFSLAIAAGETVALVGASGAGKTTLCALIPRFYETGAGEIRIDGTPIRDIQLASLRRHIGIVQQDTYLFAGTIAQNLRYGRPDASAADLVAAAKNAQAHDFIAALPRSYDTEIGQRGVTLSGGQKQRLAIARVFLRDPAILILDEATSALDNESEAAVQQALLRLARGRTTLIIAHRLSTIRHAGRILVLGEQGILEEGRHDDLLAAGGAYARLYAAQRMA